jgi:putative SOS response-associated peptidase YedK
MCSHYQMIKDQERIAKYFRSHGSPVPLTDLWPNYPGLFIRRPSEWESGDEAVPERESIIGRWGLIPQATRADGLVKAERVSGFNARSETAHKLWTFKHAWARGQRCIIPAEAIFEPDWRSGNAIATRFYREDGAPLGIAGLWDRYRDAAGQWQESYTMLTINADRDPLFMNYHRPEKEKRMVVILPDGAYEDWLTAPIETTRDFMVPYPADRLVAERKADESQQALPIE